MYDFEFERVASEVVRSGSRRVLVQAPDGLKQFLGDFIPRLSKLCRVYVSTSPCYGGCDLEYERARILGVDLVVHLGHEKFMETEGALPTVYVPATHITDAKGLVGEAAGFLKTSGYRRVGVVANIQHRGILPEFVEALKREGIDPVIDSKTGGVVLGCRTEGAKRLEGEVEAFLFIGGGDFHALGVALEVDKEVFVADPYGGGIRDTRAIKRRALAKMWWAINQAADAKKVGVVLVTKTGQYNPRSADVLASELEGMGKEIFMLTGEEASWERLSAFPFIESFIVTGCPRIAIDNREWPKPVLNENEARELIRKLRERRK